MKIDKIKNKIDSVKDEYINISHKISENPELQNEEFFAKDILTNILKNEGFEIEENVCGYATGFVAKKGSGNPKIGFLAEYDALPDIGHGCGHNIIGTLSSLAAVGLADVLEESKGTVYVFGTPAEEGGNNGSSKSKFASEGVFDDVDVAMLLHPSNRNTLTSSSLVVYSYDFEFFGKTSHASAYPEKGINALDAMILFYNGINALRQQCTPDVRIHGVITEGGKAPNVIPDYTKAKFFIRASYLDTGKAVLDKVIKIAEGSAISTGCTFKATSFNNDVYNIIPTPKFDELFQKIAFESGVDYTYVPEDSPVGSSDVGNVTHKIPVIQPTIEVCDINTHSHTIEFTNACVSEIADKELVRGAKNLALTGLELIENADLLNEIKNEHKNLLIKNNI